VLASRFEKLRAHAVRPIMVALELQVSETGGRGEAARQRKNERRAQSEAGDGKKKGVVALSTQDKERRRAASLCPYIAVARALARADCNVRRHRERKGCQQHRLSHCLRSKLRERSCWEADAAAAVVIVATKCQRTKRELCAADAHRAEGSARVLRGWVCARVQPRRRWRTPPMLTATARRLGACAAGSGLALAADAQRRRAAHEPPLLWLSQAPTCCDAAPQEVCTMHMHTNPCSWRPFAMMPKPLSCFDALLLHV
jgi:hypothetical protein